MFGQCRVPRYYDYALLCLVLCKRKVTKKSGVNEMLISFEARNGKIHAQSLTLHRRRDRRITRPPIVA